MVQYESDGVYINLVADFQYFIFYKTNSAFKNDNFRISFDSTKSYYYVNL